METTPAPEENVPVTNGVNGAESSERGSQDGEESGPVPPPHRSQKSPSPQSTPAAAPEPEPEVLKVDAEACKAAGNKFYKAGSYQQAIDEYSKGLSYTLRIACLRQG